RKSLSVTAKNKATTHEAIRSTDRTQRKGHVPAIRCPWLVAHGARTVHGRLAAQQRRARRYPDPVPYPVRLRFANRYGRGQAAVYYRCSSIIRRMVTSE